MQVILNNEALAKSLGKNKGDTFDVPCGADGVPTTREWRNRLKDSDIDNCVTVVDAKTTKKRD